VRRPQRWLPCYAVTWYGMHHVRSLVLRKQQLLRSARCNAAQLNASQRNQRAPEKQGKGLSRVVRLFACSVSACALGRYKERQCVVCRCAKECGV